MAPMRQRVPSFPARKTHRRKWARYTRSLVWVPAVSQRRKVLRQARLRVGSGADLVQDAPPANTPITLHLAIQTPNNLPLAVSPPNRPAIASPPPSLRRPTQPSQKILEAAAELGYMSLNSEPDLFDTEEMPRVANGGYDRLEPALNMASEASRGSARHGNDPSSKGSHHPDDLAGPIQHSAPDEESQEPVRMTEHQRIIGCANLHQSRNVSSAPGPDLTNSLSIETSMQGEQASQSIHNSQLSHIRTPSLAPCNTRQHSPSLSRTLTPERPAWPPRTLEAVNATSSHCPPSLLSSAVLNPAARSNDPPKALHRTPRTSSPPSLPQYMTNTQTPRARMPLIDPLATPRVRAYTTGRPADDPREVAAGSTPQIQATSGRASKDEKVNAWPLATAFSQAPSDTPQEASRIHSRLPVGSGSQGTVTNHTSQPWEPVASASLSTASTSQVLVTDSNSNASSQLSTTVSEVSLHTNANSTSNQTSNHSAKRKRDNPSFSTDVNLSLWPSFLISIPRDSHERFINDARDQKAGLNNRRHIPSRRRFLSAITDRSHRAEFRALHETEVHLSGNERRLVLIRAPTTQCLSSSSVPILQYIEYDSHGIGKLRLRHVPSQNAILNPGWRQAVSLYIAQSRIAGLANLEFRDGVDPVTGEIHGTLTAAGPQNALSEFLYLVQHPPWADDLSAANASTIPLSQSNTESSPSRGNSKRRRSTQ